MNCIEAKKTRELFRKYGLDVHSFEVRSFLSPNYLFPQEEKFKEVRVHLGAICDEDWLRDQYEVITVEEYKNRFSHEHLKDFKKDLKKAEEKNIREISESLTFSVFIKKEDFNHLSIKKEEDILFVYESAFYYMQFLKYVPKVYEAIYDDDVFPSDIESFVEILNCQGIEVTNDNLEVIPKVSYRLYKDSKFFYELSEFLGDRVKEKFINEFLDLINNPEY